VASTTISLIESTHLNCFVQMELETASTDSEAAGNDLEEDGEESDDEDDEDSDKEEDDENGNSNSAAEKINQILRPNAENAILVSQGSF